MVKTRQNLILQTQSPRKKFSLQLLHQRLGQGFKRSLLDEDTANIWQDIELRIDPEPFYTSCQI